MKLTNTRILKKKAGMTLIELTVVILVLLALIAVLFVGARAYMKASERTACLMNQRNIDQACRSFFNLNPTEASVTDADIFGAEAFIAVAPKCNGVDFFVRIVNGEAPRDLAANMLYTKCPYYGSDGPHDMPDHELW